MSVLDLEIQRTPIAVVDIETTGLLAGADRVVELSVVRVEPDGGVPTIVLDTLVNPTRPVAATEIHGITDADVADAPTFREVREDVLAAISGSVVAAYNVYFDVRFLADELGRVGVPVVPPHLCLMYMRPMLGLGTKCSLTDACRACGVTHSGAHVAGDDALAGAGLWRVYQSAMTNRGVRTFRELAALRDYKFVSSFSRAPLGAPSVAAGRGSARLKSRRGDSKPRIRSATAEYWDALTAALADLDLSVEEERHLASRRAALGLTSEEVRGLHGRVFAASLATALEDAIVTQDEWQRLKQLHSCLARLGWAPGL